MTKAYKLKGSEAVASDPIEELKELHDTAARVEKTDRDIAALERDLAAIRAANCKPLEERIAKLRESATSGREFIRQALVARPKDLQKLHRGNVTYHIRAGSESVEILDEAKALAEVKALGPAGLPCVAVKETLVKAGLKGLLKNPEAPRLEHVRLNLGEPTLAEKGI